MAEIIDYKNEDLAAQIMEITEGTGVDAEVDMDFSTTVGLLSAGVWASHTASMSATARTYRVTMPYPLATCCSEASPCNSSSSTSCARTNATSAVADLDTMLKSGGLAHLIGARFPLIEIAAAHETVEAGHLVGNVVLDLIDRPVPPGASGHEERDISRLQCKHRAWRGDAAQLVFAEWLQWLRCSGCEGAGENTV